MTFSGIDVKDAQDLLERGTVCIVDTRPPFDYAGGRIPGSINLPGSSIRTRKGLVPAGQHVLILASDDDRAVEGCRTAQQLGFTVAGYVRGGFDAWADADYPVDTISDGMGMPGPGRGGS
jgi:rhodanese-related sulfurtransferase